MEALNSPGARHIQDLTTAESLEPHWGYADRAVPCTNDPGSCEYLDAVYESHDLGMLYSGILWITLGGIILIWGLFKHASRPSFPTAPGASNAGKAGLSKVRRSLRTLIRQYLLPDAARLIFGRTTRLQVLLLAALSGYLLVWSFVGIVYNTWVTPVSDMPGVYNTRTSLGPWSDRVGILAYALTPLSVMLSNRESILSLLTGVPYQSFNFLHRWLGYIIFVQSSMHTITWSIVELRLYQPQPTVGIEWIKQLYIIWGVVAMFILTLMVMLSTPWGIRFTGYEFFRKAHYVLAMIYIGACWGHWAQLKCFLLPSLIFWFIDRGARLVRTAFLHYHYLPTGTMGFEAAQAAVTHFPDSEHGDVIRLDLENDQDAWNIGQHYYLCFTESSIWQSHPFTPLNAPAVQNGRVRHSYILRAKSGETKKVADLAAKKQADPTTSIILTGAYGESVMDRVSSDTNIVCVAGGTGITYVLPILLELARQPISPDRRIELVWAVRHAHDAEWVRAEMDLLHRVRKALNLKIRLYATRDVSSRTPSLQEKGQESENANAKEVGSSSSSSLPDDCDCGMETPVKRIGGASTDNDRHPDLPKLISSFIGETIRGPTTVFASGPGGMISDLRDIVAHCNSGSKVWNGEEKYDVSLVCDDRLEW